MKDWPITIMFVAQRLGGAGALAAAYFFMAAGGFWMGLIGFVCAIAGLVAIAGDINFNRK